MESESVHPDPTEFTVLDLQEKHRSSDIWAGLREFDVLFTRRADLKFWHHIHDHPPHDRIIRYLQGSPFWGVYTVGRIQYDRSLITALVERWRPETHTFHFCCGEATITLQDVELMYGIPVDGRPICTIGRNWGRSKWVNELDRLTGFSPVGDECKGHRLQISALHRHLSRLGDITDETDDEVVRQHCRLYMLWIIGGILFPDGGSRASLLYLPMLEDLDRIGELSWGSAVLAFLYRCLSQASLKGTKNIGGFLALLQVWAWERLLPVQPTPRPEPPAPADVVDHPPPDPPTAYAKKWARGVDRDIEPDHILPLYRDKLDSMTTDQFVWQPYSEITIAELPEWCSRGRGVWMAIVPLCCGDIVENHAPDRVLRQFGLAQGVPDRVTWDKSHFMRDGRSKVDDIYEQFLEDQHGMWEQRYEKIVRGIPSHVRMLDNDPYMIWYRKITRLLIGNPTRHAARGYDAYAGKHEALNASIQGSELSFDQEYAPPTEYQDGPKVNFSRSSGACRGRGGGGRGRGSGRRGGRVANIEHHLGDEVEAASTSTSYSNLKHCHVKPYYDYENAPESDEELEEELNFLKYWRTLIYEFGYCKSSLILILLCFMLLQHLDSVPWLSPWK